MPGCYFCGSAIDIEEHHIVPQRFDGSDKESNTVDLCHDCHWKLERLYNKEFWEAIGVEDPRATKESHVTCQYHSCTEPSTGRYTIAAPTGITHVYRCDEHRPERLQEKQQEEEEKELRSVDMQGSTRFKRDVGFAFNELIGKSRVDLSEVRETLTGDRVKQVISPTAEEENLSEVMVAADSGIYSAKYNGGGWVVEYEGGPESSQ